MSEARKKELIDQLVEHRTLKSQGSRAGCRASAIDAHKNIASITKEVSFFPHHKWRKLIHGTQMKNLYLRTGVRSFAFFSRSHVEDTTTSFTATSDDTVMKFFPEILKLDFAEVMAKFEMYACLENRCKSLETFDFAGTEKTWLL